MFVWEIIPEDDEQKKLKRCGCCLIPDLSPSLIRL